MTATRTHAVLVGQGIGDGLGMPFEKLGDEVHPDLATWDGSYQPGTWHELPRGHWTDDTEMAECLATSLVACRGFDGAEKVPLPQRGGAEPEGPWPQASFQSRARKWLGYGLLAAIGGIAVYGISKASSGLMAATERPKGGHFRRGFVAEQKAPPRIGIYGTRS